MRTLFSTTVLLCLFVHAAVWSDGLFNVPMVAQKKSNWCWAASANCIINFYCNSDTVPQEDCVKLIKGDSLPNSQASANDISKILTAFKIPSKTSSGNFSQQIANEDLDKYNPFVIRYQWNSGGGHFVVCSGYKDSIYKVMNPWPPNKGEWTIGTFQYVTTKGGTAKWEYYTRTSAQVSKTVTVVYPNGGEKLVGGQSIDIAFKNMTLSKSKVELLKAGQPVKVITENAMESITDSTFKRKFTYKWTIPADLQSGSDYTIKVSVQEKASPQDVSDAAFSISSSTAIDNALGNTVKEAPFHLNQKYGTDIFFVFRKDCILPKNRAVLNIYSTRGECIHSQGITNSVVSLKTGQQQIPLLSSGVYIARFSWSDELGNHTVSQLVNYHK